MGKPPKAFVGLCGEGTFDMASRLRMAVGGVEKDAETGVRGDEGGNENAILKGEEGTEFENEEAWLSLSSSMCMESDGRRPEIERQ